MRFLQQCDGVAVATGRMRARWIALCVVLSFLLSGAVAAQDLRLDQVGAFARSQIEALIAEKESRTPVQQKIDSALLRTVDAHRATPQFPILDSLPRAVTDDQSRVVVDIELFEGRPVEAVAAAIENVGGEVIFASARFHSIRAAVPVASLETIAAEPDVRFVYNKHVFDTDKVNVSEGVVTHKADLVQSTLGYTGNGQKICALSDGVSSRAARQATGDLPAIVDVLPGQAGSGDEGTAMLEIIADMAPGARLGFATANGGLAQFAQNILDLGNPAIGGCTVIVDDIAYTSESIYQDSVVAQAVSTVTAAGISYFASAGNSGGLDQARSGTWEGTFNASGNVTNALIPGYTLHEFAPGVTQNVALASATQTFMHWAAPNGAAGVDYDLYVLNAAATMVLGSSTNTQNGTQDPYEYVALANGVSLPSGARLVVAKKAGAGDRMLWVQWYRSRLTNATNGATKGHGAVPAAYGVAATPAVAPGPYPGSFTTANTVELFSSDGPRKVFFDSTGALLPGAPAGDFTSTGGVVRLKPDITAADGVATQAQPQTSFNPFYGTSAAAPHAAAIMGLLRQAFPAWTSAQLRTALTTSALDIHGAGWDRNSGAGIVMPLAALQANGAPAIAGLKLTSVTPTQVNGNGDVSIDAGEDWKLDIVLGSLGGVTGTGIVATLTSDVPGVVVTSGPVSYPDIAVGVDVANPAGTPFRFSLFSPLCGANISFTLSVATAQSAVPQTLKIVVPVQTPLGAVQTFSYAGPSVPIPDGTGANVPGTTAVVSVPVSGVSSTIGDVDLRIDGLNACASNLAANAGIAHSYVGDLVLALRSPDATNVNVVNRINSGGTQGPNLCNATFDDESAGAPIGTALDAAAPFTGSWLPSSALSAFRGKNANGTWQFRATDFYSGDTGSINRFSILIKPFVCTPSVRNVAIAATRTVAGSFAPGGTVIYTVTLTNTGNGVQADNVGDEYSEVLPNALTLQPGVTTATRGTLAFVGKTIKWNGSLDAGASVVLTIVATINPNAGGMVISTQGVASFDANHAGVNSAQQATDDPTVGGAINPTVFTVSGVPTNLDIDGNGVYDPLTDGVLVLRHMLGMSGAALTSGAIGANAQRLNAAQVAPYLGTIPAQLDIDGNGTVDALTDGLLIVRYMRGLRGSALVAGVVAANATRNAAQIEAYLGSVMP